MDKGMIAWTGNGLTYLYEWAFCILWWLKFVRSTGDEYIYEG